MSFHVGLISVGLSSAPFSVATVPFVGNAGKQAIRVQRVVACAFLAPPRLRPGHSDTSTAKRSHAVATLHLEPVAAATATSLLELSALGAHIGLDAAVGVHRVDRRSVAEVPVRLSRVPRPAQQHRVAARGRPKRQLVEGDALSARLDDRGARGGREAQCTHDERGHLLDHPRVSRHRADQHGDLVLLPGHVANQAAQAERRAVVLALVQALQHHLGEARVCPPAQEAVQLAQQLLVQVVPLGRLARLVAHAPASRSEIDAHGVLRIALFASWESAGDDRAAFGSSSAILKFSELHLVTERERGSVTERETP
eukprot:scaffold1981_cov345-Pinguiococcus_pyrenoidosus.AAC.10